MKTRKFFLLLTLTPLLFTTCIGGRLQQAEAIRTSEYARFLSTYEENGDTLVLSYREIRPHGLYLQFFGPTVLGVNYDYHLSNSLDVELGLGIGLDIQMGGRYHPFGDANCSPYAGFFITRIRVFYPGLFGGETGWGPESKMGFYIPLGMEIYTNKALTFLVEGGYNYSTDKAEDWGQINTRRGIYFAVRIGFHFQQSDR